MQVHIENIHIHHQFSAEALASMDQLMEKLGRSSQPLTEAENKPFHTHINKPQIGEIWPGQGGHYAGDIRAEDGTTYALIISDCGEDQDIGPASWGPNASLSLSSWNGLANTRILNKENPAAQLAARHSADGHNEFYLPARRELQLACATVPHLFGESSWYWSSTPYSSEYAWAVDFENGRTNYYDRLSQFRVRPVRRFIY